jgi:phytoene dehydrogenase-like protein
MAAEAFDAVVVGAGPNGLAAAIELLRAGRSVLVLEAEEVIGGGARTEELTLPGFRHDVCSAIHPLGALSPFLASLPLAENGVEWLQPDIPLAHPLDDGSAGTLLRDLDATARSLAPDTSAWKGMFGSYVDDAHAFFAEILKPVRIPSRPFMLARFGFTALQSAEHVAQAWFRGPHAQALFAGCASHSMMSLEHAGTASFGIVLAVAAHAVGWPLARGGSSRITDAMASYLRSLGGEIRTSHRVTSLSELPASKAVLFDVMPSSLVAIAGDALPPWYARALLRYRHGPGVFKIDWALDGPIPWTAEECRRAGTVHLGGTFEEVVASERAASERRVAGKPFVLVAQQSLFDDTRAPAGKHTGWAYCHVPNGSSVDMTDAIEAQMERFAPGFRDLVLARHVMNPAAMQRHNSNLIGGDIGGGSNDLAQTLARPIARWDPYATPNPRLYLCSSATPPGGGVHGMCGYWAARSALSRSFSSRS